MSALTQPRIGARRPGTTALADAIRACQRAAAPGRALDAYIACAVFPALGELAIVGLGIWLHPDGIRVRALRYSASCTAATTLVPPGCWIEPSRSRTIVAGAQGEWAGTHQIDALALCIAALGARIAAATQIPGGRLHRCTLPAPTGRFLQQL